MKQDCELDRDITEEESIKLEILGEQMGMAVREVSDFKEFIFPKSSGIPNFLQTYYIMLAVWFSELICDLWDLLGVKEDQEKLNAEMRAQRETRLRKEQERWDREMAALESSSDCTALRDAASPPSGQSASRSAEEDCPRSPFETCSPSLATSGQSGLNDDEIGELARTFSPTNNPMEKKAEKFLALAKEWATLSGPMPVPLDFSGFANLRKMREAELSSSRLPFETHSQSLVTSGQSGCEVDGPDELASNSDCTEVARSASLEVRSEESEPSDDAPDWNPQKIVIPWHTDVYADYLRRHGRMEDLAAWYKQRDWFVQHPVASDLWADEQPNPVRSEEERSDVSKTTGSAQPRSPFETCSQSLATSGQSGLGNPVGVGEPRDLIQEPAEAGDLLTSPWCKPGAASTPSPRAPP